MTRKRLATFRRQGRAELTCLYCGHALGEVPVPPGRRPTNAELRAAYAASPDRPAPAWDAHGMPRCPRCAARLFIELGHLRTQATDRVRRTKNEYGDEEREDAYAREDVYVAAESSPD
jgi:hypothetical protein